VYSLREEIDRGKWVVRGRLNIPWTTPLPVGASLLATSRAHRSRPRRLCHLWASPSTRPIAELKQDALSSVPGIQNGNDDKTIEAKQATL
jgi:hypothetical protein